MTQKQDNANLKLMIPNLTLTPNHLLSFQNMINCSFGDQNLKTSIGQCLDKKKVTRLQKVCFLFAKIS